MALDDKAYHPERDRDIQTPTPRRISFQYGIWSQV